MTDAKFKQVSDIMHTALLENHVPSVYDLLNALRGGGDCEKDPAVFLPPPLEKIAMYDKEKED